MLYPQANTRRLAGDALNFAAAGDEGARRGEPPSRGSR